MDNPLVTGRRRTRMVSFRVSEREFEQLRARSEADGARSISDYARHVLCESTADPGDQAGAHIHRLSDDIQHLSAEVRRVSALLEGPRQVFRRPTVASIAGKTGGT